MVPSSVRSVWRTGQQQVVILPKSTSPTKNVFSPHTDGFLSHLSQCHVVISMAIGLPFKRAPVDPVGIGFAPVARAVSKAAAPSLSAVVASPVFKAGAQPIDKEQGCNSTGHVAH